MYLSSCKNVFHRNATRRWKQAVAGEEQTNNDGNKVLRQQKSLTEPLSVVIRATSMNEDQQKQALFFRLFQIILLIFRPLKLPTLHWTLATLTFSN
jgi:hypothetical protein